MKSWIVAERENLGDDSETGQSNWERSSVPLAVSDDERAAFETFRTAFADESAVLDDDSLAREEEILTTLIEWTDTAE
jgi:hypothetical protein